MGGRIFAETLHPASAMSNDPTVPNNAIPFALSPDASLADPSLLDGVDVNGIARRDFLRIATAGAGAILATGSAACASVPAATVRGIEPQKRGAGNSVGHVVVIGAGAWGGWTSYHLRQRGVRVTLIDAYGAGNSRSTSGDESRGIRSSYGDRATGELWTPWAREAIKRWGAFEAEWGPVFRTKFYHQTGDIIMREKDEPFLKRTIELWKANNVAHEVLTGDEVRKRWPVINADDTTIAIYEPDAGVARARASTQAVAAIAIKMGATFIQSRVTPGPIKNGQMDGVVLQNGDIVRGDSYVFACGPWLRKLFPYMENRMRVPLGYVTYWGTPVGDSRFTYPNLPSYNFPGVTGWAALPTDMRGFRVRGGIAAPQPVETPEQRAEREARAKNAPPPPPPDPLQNDPDTSTRWAAPSNVDGMRRFVQRRFPLLANAPLLETRCCHYEQSINRDFIVDHVPDTTNAWIAGVGQAEGFKFGPVVGEYVAQRVLGVTGDPKLVAAFKLPTDQYEAPRPPGGDDFEE